MQVKKRAVSRSLKRQPVVESIRPLLGPIIEVVPPPAQGAWDSDRGDQYAIRPSKESSLPMPTQ
jgi:hypothetical protein